MSQLLSKLLRPRVRTALSIVCIAFFLQAAPASGAPRLQGSLTLQKSGQGSLNLSVGGLSASPKILSAGTQLKIGIDDYRFNLNIRSRKKRGSSGNSILATNRKNTAIGTLSTLLDTRSKSLSFKAKNTVLAGLNNPFHLSVELGGKKICQTVRLNAKDKANKSNFTIAPLGASGCAISDTPRISPDTITVGDTTPLRARISLPEKLRSVPVELYSMKSDGSPGAVLCKMSDDGSPAAQDMIPADGTFSCVFNLSAASARTVSMAVGAGRGRKKSFSSGIEFSVVRAVNQADLDEVKNFAPVAKAAFDSAFGKFGDTIEMRLDIIKALLKRPEVQSAGLSANQLDIWITYRSGIEGVMALTPQPDGSVGPLVPKISKSSASVMKLASSGQEVGMSIEPGFRRPSSNDSQSVLIYDPGYFGNDYDESFLIEKLMGEMAEPPFTVYSYRGSAAGIEELKMLSGFGTIIFVTHGSIGKSDQLLMHTAPTKDKNLVQKYKPYHKVDSLNGDVFLVPASFIEENNTFNGALVYGGFCNSAFNNDFANAFLGKGAAVFFGYTRAVPTSFAQACATQLFCAMLLQGDDSVSAFNDVTPKIGTSSVEFVARGNQSVSYPVDNITNIPIQLNSDQTDPIILLKPDWVGFGIKTGDRDLASCVKGEFYTAKEGLGQVTDFDLKPLENNKPYLFKNPMGFNYQATSEKPGTDEVFVRILTLNEEEELTTVSRKVEIGCKRLESFDLSLSKDKVKPQEDVTITAKVTGESKDKECQLEYEWKLSYDKDGFTNDEGPFCHKWANGQPGLDATSAVINSADCSADDPKGKPGVHVIVYNKWGTNPVRRIETGNTGAYVEIECLACGSEQQGFRTPSDLCTPVEACCSDKVDNDSDGDVDCDDTDCKDNKKCQPDCADVDVTSMQSVCGTISGLPATVQPGDTVTVSSFYYCNNGVGGEVGLSYATSNVIVDGVPMVATSGAPYIYDYRVQPVAMMKVPVAGGTHSLTFTIRSDAPLACIKDVNGYFPGPWAILGAPGWSSPRHFKVGF